MIDTPILIEHTGPVALIRLNRPERMNALNNALVRALVDALTELDRSGSTGAAVITGNARAFAAGADIGELAGDGPDLDVWDQLREIGIPLIAAVRGLALGGGLELAMACDLFVVAEDARLGQPEITLGLMPGAGGTQRLTRAVGKTLAMEMVLLGREIDGRLAYERGLANACVPDERVLPVALHLAVGLCKGPPVAIRTAKRLVNLTYEESLANGLADERRGFRELLQTADGREGTAAFLEKRKPTWSGK
jgi:enoyl-CoA hydratase